MRHGIELDSADYAGRTSSRQAVFGADTAADELDPGGAAEEDQLEEGSELADGGEEQSSGDNDDSVDGTTGAEGNLGADEDDRADGTADEEALAGDTDGLVSGFTWSGFGSGLALAVRVRVRVRFRVTPGEAAEVRFPSAAGVGHCFLA